MPPRVLLHSPSSHLRRAPGGDQGPSITLLCFSPQPSASMAPSDSRRGWSASFGSLVTFASFWKTSPRSGKWWSLCKPLGHLGLAASYEQWDSCLNMPRRRRGDQRVILGSSERPHFMPWARAHVPRVLSADPWPQTAKSGKDGWFGGVLVPQRSLWTAARAHE